MLVHFFTTQSRIFDEVDEVRSPAMNLIAEEWAEEWTSRTDHEGGAGHHPTTSQQRQNQSAPPLQHSKNV
jgi:hypothetical protein